MKTSFTTEPWPIRGTFAISRGAKKEAEVIVVTIEHDGYRGRGEGVPYRRYGETVSSAQEQISAIQSEIEKGVDRGKLSELLPAGAARNALDCALWDLECKQKGKTIWELLRITPKPMPISYTIGLDGSSVMAEKAREAAKKYSILKLKLGAKGDEERLQKIREAAPKARLIVDANEGWNAGNLEAMLRACESAGVELLEQPVPVEHSNILKNVRTSVSLCADESAHTSADIEKLQGIYQAVNIKLDKAGGLTEALVMAQKAKEAGLKIMVGCIVSTSLSMAPATVVAQYADYVDLDGPLHLAKDRAPAIEYRDGIILPTTPELWG